MRARRIHRRRLNWLWLTIDGRAVALLIQLPAEGSIFRAESADKLLILLDVVLHGPHLIFLDPLITRDEIAFSIILAPGQQRDCERSANRARCRRAIPSQCKRAKMQEYDLKRLREQLLEKRWARRNSAFPETLIENRERRVKASVFRVRD